MRFGVGICFLIVTGAMVRVIIHEAPGRVSKQKREPGESEELFAGTRERGQISNVWLGIYSVAELLPCTHSPFPAQHKPDVTASFLRLNGKMTEEGDKYSSVSISISQTVW